MDKIGEKFIFMKESIFEVFLEKVYYLALYFLKINYKRKGIRTLWKAVKSNISSWIGSEIFRDMTLCGEYLEEIKDTSSHFSIAMWPFLQEKMSKE